MRRRHKDLTLVPLAIGIALVFVWTMSRVTVALGTAQGKGHHVAFAGAVAAPIPAACRGNLIINPGFEEGFTVRGRPDALLPNGWDAWFERLPGIDGLNYPPVFRSDRDSEHVGAGLWSLEQRTSDATHTGGVWQRVEVGRDVVIRAWAWSYAWASLGSQPDESIPPGTYATAIGVDPSGGADPTSASIVWTSPITTTDAWVEHALDLTATGPVVTVFTRGQPLQILPNNESRWDAFCLRALGPAGTEPGPRDVASSPESISTITSEDDATAMAAGVFATATARSAPEPAEDDPDPGVIIGAAATMAAAATRVAAAPRSGLAPATEDEPPAVPFVATILDHLGFIAVAGALFCAGVIYGLGGKNPGTFS